MISQTSSLLVPNSQYQGRCPIQMNSLLKSTHLQVQAEQTVPNWTRINPWTCQCGLADEHCIPANNTCRMQVQRFQNASFKWLYYISRSPESTRLNISNPGLVNMVWRRGVDFLFHGRPQQPLETKSNTSHWRCSLIWEGVRSRSSLSPERR